MAAVSEAELTSSEISGPALQESIIRLFRALTGKEARPDDDFFDLGGDSLGAVTIMAFIEEEFGVSLPVSAILEGSTPRALTRIITEAGPGAFASSIVRIQETGSGAPLFVVHGLGGDVALVRTVAAATGPSRPVYGLRAIGLRAGEEPISGIPEMATHYISEIRRVRPTGPYVLHGYCGGAFIAYEIAQQLRRAGEDVKGLVMVDPPLDWRRSPFLVASRFWLVVLKSAASARYYWAILRSMFQKAGSEGNRRVQVARTLWRSLALYQPEPYPLDALMIYCGESRDIIQDSRNGGMRSLMPKGRFVEAGATHRSLFAQGARAFTEAKNFIDLADPPGNSECLQETAA